VSIHLPQNLKNHIFQRLKSDVKDMKNGALDVVKRIVHIYIPSNSSSFDDTCRNVRTAILALTSKWSSQKFRNLGDR
jgi:hypothetical protein